ncbi:MAG: sporulation protein YqfC [Clostridiaceae bacterium]|nr:sporulation protein YqfC [Clostridiaceae bacterium]
MRKTKKQKKQSRIDKFLEIPKEISSEEPKIILTGFSELIIENYKGILEYQDFYIRISTHIGIININGYELDLNEMTTDDILVTGKIETIDLEKTID